MFGEGFGEHQNRKVVMEVLARQEVRKKCKCVEAHAILFPSVCVYLNAVYFIFHCSFCNSVSCRQVQFQSG